MRPRLRIATEVSVCSSHRGHTLRFYVRLYNQQHPQSALGTKSTLQATSRYICIRNSYTTIQDRTHHEQKTITFAWRHRTCELFVFLAASYGTSRSYNDRRSARTDSATLHAIRNSNILCWSIFCNYIFHAEAHSGDIVKIYRYYYGDIGGLILSYSIQTTYRNIRSGALRMDIWKYFLLVREFLSPPTH